MSQVEETSKKEFLFLYIIKENEVQELRKFIDSEIDFTALKGIDVLFDRLNHLLDRK